MEDTGLKAMTTKEICMHGHDRVQIQVELQEKESQVKVRISPSSSFQSVIPAAFGQLLPLLLKDPESLTHECNPL